MLAPNLYKVPPYVVSPSLKSCFIVLLVMPKNWRLLLLNEGHSVRICFIVSGVSFPQSSHVGVPESHNETITDISYWSFRSSGAVKCPKTSFSSIGGNNIVCSDNIILSLRTYKKYTEQQTLISIINVVGRLPLQKSIAPLMTFYYVNSLNDFVPAADLRVVG